MKKNLKFAINIFLICIFVFGIYYVVNKRRYGGNEKNKSSDISTTSYCLKVLEQVNAASFINQSEWEAAEIDKLDEEPVSINSLKAKKFQEASRNKKEIQANYGPFIMEKTETKGGAVIQETNPELIKCAHNKIIISIWQP